MKPRTTCRMCGGPLDLDSDSLCSDDCMNDAANEWFEDHAELYREERG